MEDPDKLEDNRNPDGTFKKGFVANPNGRPKGKTLKEFAREFYMNKTEEEKLAYINKVEEAKPGFSWQMAEGNPETKSDITSGGKPIISISPEIAAKNELNSGTENDSE